MPFFRLKNKMLQRSNKIYGPWFTLTEYGYQYFEDQQQPLITSGWVWCANEDDAIFHLMSTKNDDE